MSAKTTTKKPAAKAKAAKKPAASPGARKAARAAIDRAKDAGAIGPNGTQAQRALRDGAIMAALTAGAKQKEVAADLGVSERTVRLVAKSYAERPSALNAMPMEIVEDFVRSMRLRIAEFEAMAYHHADSNAPVSLGAKKAAQTTAEKLFEVLGELGKLPDNLELFRAESTIRQIAKEMTQAMLKLKRGEITIEEAMDVYLAVATEDEELSAGV